MSGFQLGGWGRNKAKKVYTADERASYVRQARQLLAKSGSTVPAVAENLGLHPGTLYTWLRQPSPARHCPPKPSVVGAHPDRDGRRLPRQSNINGQAPGLD
jgi:transposase-like protein